MNLLIFNFPTSLPVKIEQVTNLILAWWGNVVANVIPFWHRDEALVGTGAAWNTIAAEWLTLDTLICSSHHCCSGDCVVLTQHSWLDRGFLMDSVIHYMCIMWLKLGVYIVGQKLKNILLLRQFASQTFFFPLIKRAKINIYKKNKTSI